MKVKVIIWFLASGITFGSSGSNSLRITNKDTAEWTTKQKIHTAIIRGDSAMYSGELAEAEKHYKRGYALVTKALAEGKGLRISVFNPSIFDPVNKLGRLFLLTNNLTKAEFYFEQSRRLGESHLAKNSLFRVPPLIGLGEIYLAQNDLDNARSHLEMAEKLFQSATTSFYNPNDIGKSILINQFEIALKQKDYKKAAKYMNKLSSGGSGTMLDKNARSKIPRVFELKARYYLSVGDYDQSRYYLGKAKDFAVALSDEIILFKIFRTEALLYWTNKDIQGAFAVFKDLTRSYKNYIIENFGSMSEYEREGFFGNLKRDFDLYNAFVLQNIEYDQVDELYELAYDNQLFSKALLLNQINKIKNSILTSGDKDLIDQLNQWESAKALLSSLYYQKNRDQKLIDETESKINELERVLNRKTGLLNTINREVNWSDVRGTLKEDEVAVEIIRTRGFNLIHPDKDVLDFEFNEAVHYIVLVVSAQTVSPTAVVIRSGADLESRYANMYRNSIKLQFEDTTSYQQYWRPLGHHVKQFKTVYLSTDGIYNQINLNTLRDPERKQFLLDQVNLVLVTNTKDLITRKVRPDLRKASLFGRPEFLLDSVGNEMNGVSDERSELRSFNSKIFDNFREQTFIDLPGTEKEIYGIENILTDKGWQVQTNFGSAATERNLKRSANPSILHIATHGFFLQEDNTDGVNSMIRSGIILAGVNKPSTSSDDDGVLTAYEATNLDLDSTYLVVLSACETGLGQIRNGEGVYGLQRGLAVAGTRYVLMSLWKVDDFATGLLMESFYNNWLESGDIHRGFHEAQVALRRKYPHPFYWGAFVLLGN